MWFSGLGALVCVSVGLLGSFITGKLIAFIYRQVIIFQLNFSHARVVCYQELQSHQQSIRIWLYRFSTGFSVAFLACVDVNCGVECPYGMLYSTKMDSLCTLLAMIIKKKMRKLTMILSRCVWQLWLDKVWARPIMKWQKIAIWMGNKQDVLNEEDCLKLACYILWLTVMIQNTFGV